MLSLASLVTVAPTLTAQAEGTPLPVTAGVGLLAFLILVGALVVTMQFNRHRWEERARSDETAAHGEGTPHGEGAQQRDTGRLEQPEAATPAAAQVGPRTPWEGEHAGRARD